MKKPNPVARDLLEAIIRLESIDDAQRFFDDLCTPAELLAMADRWRVARLLADGVPYREIHERTGVSTATVTRVARALTYGEEGYRTMLARIDQPMNPLTRSAPVAGASSISGSKKKGENYA